MIECFGFLVYMQCALPAQSTTVVCPPLIEWRADVQKRAALELRALPAGSAVRELIARAIEQRDVNKRCIASKQRGVKP